MATASEFRAGDYLAPRHWPTWLALGILRTAYYLPYRWQMVLGAGLGRLLYYALPRRRRIVRTNLALAFPGLSEAERDALARRHFRAAGRTAFECGLAWWAPAERLAPLAHVHGLGHLEEALARGKGVILLSGHFTSFELGGRLLSLYKPLQFMYKPQRKNPLFEALTLRWRSRHYAAAVRHDNARGMAKGLRANRVCWYLPDQDMGRRGAVFVPFMGVEAATSVAPGRFARMSGAAVVPYYPRRRADGSGYDLYIEPAFEDFPSGDDEADAARLNAFLERAIRGAPEQYVWAHRRFKTLREGGKRRY